MFSTIVSSFLSLAWLAATIPAQTQSCTPGWMGGFGQVPGVDEPPHASCVFDDGNGPALYIGGNFSEAGGVAASRIARWDGAHWSPLGSGLDGPVTALAALDDGSGLALYAGGNFGRAGGIAANGVARWDGSQWSAIGTGHEIDSSSYVYALAEFDDGSGPALYAGGHLERSGQPATGILRWDGSQWSDVGAGVEAYVYALAIHDDGSGPALYAGGWFSLAGGVLTRGVARWNGTNWSALGSGILGGQVFALASFDDGSGPALVVGGEFTLAGSSSTTEIAKWSGGSWSTYPNQIDVSEVHALAVYDDGGGRALYVGGYIGFVPSGSNAVPAIQRWDGAGWTVLGRGLSHPPWTLSVFDDGSGAKLIAGGYIERAGNESVRHVASWDGHAWGTLGPPADGPVGPVAALLGYDDGSGRALYVCGDLGSVVGSWSQGVASWNGSAWSPVGASLPTVFEGPLALGIHDDGSGPALYVCGMFADIGGIAASNIARWDGSHWSALGSGVGWANCMCSFDDGSGPALFVGATAPLSSSSYGSGVVKWDGAQWSGVGGSVQVGSMNGLTNAIAGFDDGSGPAIYVGGSFDQAGGVPVQNIARWNGTSWSAVGLGLGADVRVLLVHDDGSGPALYAGGDMPGGLARWNGNQWTLVGGGLGGSVRALCVHDDGSGPALFAGGDFTTAGGNPARHLARWDGANWTALGAGVEQAVLALASFDDGSCAGRSLYIGTDPNSHGLGPAVVRWGCAAQCTDGFCFGDGSSSTQVACPCANTGIAGRGCENSAASGGAQLRASGDAFADTLTLTSQGEPAGALTILVQGDAQNPGGALFGDGVRCVAGTLKRLYVKSAVGGFVTAPGPGDPSIRQQSANLGDPIAHGTRRWYQACYRDPNASFCPAPQGGTFNTSGGIEVRW